MSSTAPVQVSKPLPHPECTAHQILFGPKIEPIDYIKLYSEDKFESFIAEWAYYYLQDISGEYVQVCRFGGAGDKGRDVVAYVSLPPNVQTDVFQCKHYAGALTPSDIWPELAKLCMHTFNNLLTVPRRYRFVSPRNVGPKLGLLLEKPKEIRKQLIEVWQDTSGKDPLCKRLVAGQTVSLTGDLLKHVQGFDFSIVHYKPIEEVIREHGKTIRHAPRFGGGLVKPCPPDQSPPPLPAPSEAVYVDALLNAYRDSLKDSTLTLAMLAQHSLLHNHFSRSRERFYCAETLREFAKDALPEGTTYEAVQDQVYEAVIDIVESAFPCGYTRCKEVTRTAALVHITNHPLGIYLKSKSLQGICHQLANESRVTWAST